MWIKLSNSHKWCLQIYLEKYACCVTILVCFSKHNWELQQTINKENELSRNSLFSHSAATILVKQVHPHQNIAPLTSRSKEERIKQRKKDSTLVQFNNYLWAHTNVLFQHQYFRPHWPIFSFSHPSGKIPTSDEPIHFPMPAAEQPCSFFIYPSTRKCSSSCNYTFISVIKWLVSFPSSRLSVKGKQGLWLFLAHYCIPQRWLYR